MQTKCVTVAVAAAVLAIGAGAAADGLSPTNLPGPAELTPPLAVITQLLTGVDLTLIDEAVTDDELATAGCDDTIPSMIDDPQMLIVDDDKVQCPNAQFTSINEAVTAALPGAIIRVCPGVYRESVHVNKPGLILQAPRQQGQATQCQSSSVPDPTEEAIVVYHSAFPEFPSILIGFFLDASDVTIEGFTVQPDLTTIGSQLGIGIFANNSGSGYDIRHNVVQNNTFGIDVNSNGVHTTSVRENCLRNNNLNVPPGGFGVFSNVGLTNAVIENNFCTQQRAYCILLLGGGGTPFGNLQVNHNESINDSTIGLFGATNFTVDYNKVINPANTAIMLGTGSTSGEVSFNDLYGGPSSANGISINANQGFANPLGVANTLDVKSNKIAAFAWDGIHVDDASFGNTLETNRVQGNAMAGIRLTGQSTNNTVQNNHMRDDYPDCYDDTAGPGTAGTANFWIRDIGFTQNRPGLCNHGNE